MRRYDVVSGILFILSIIGFALAAPVLVQEKRQACVDVVHIPKDVTTVLGKRWDEELERLAEEYFKSIKKLVEPSDPHTTPTLAPPGYDHGSTSANPILLTESSGSTSTPPMEGDEESHAPLHSPTSTEHDSHAPQGNPQKRPLTDWNDLIYYNYPRPPTRRPAPPKEFGQADENQVKHVQQPNQGPSTVSSGDWPKEFRFGQADKSQVEYVQQPNAGPSTVSSFDWPKEFKFGQAHENQVEDVQSDAGLSTNSDFDSKNHEDPSRSIPASPKEIGQAHENQVEHVQQPNPGPSTDSDSDSGWNDWEMGSK